MNPRGMIPAEIVTMKPGLSLSMRYGTGATIGSKRFELIQPIAGFEFTHLSNHQSDEYYIGLNPEMGWIPHSDDETWIIRPESYSSNSVTLALVPDHWLDSTREIIPPGIRLEFDQERSCLGWAGKMYKWLGNGVDFTIGNDLYTVLINEPIQTQIDGIPCEIRLEGMKGRAGASLRFNAAPELKILRDL